MVATHSYRLSPLGPALQLGGGSSPISVSSRRILEQKRSNKLGLMHEAIPLSAAALRRARKLRSTHPALLLYVILLGCLAGVAIQQTFKDGMGR